MTRGEVGHFGGILIKTHFLLFGQLVWIKDLTYRLWVWFNKIDKGGRNIC